MGFRTNYRVVDGKAVRLNKKNKYNKMNKMNSLAKQVKNLKKSVYSGREMVYQHRTATTSVTGGQLFASNLCDYLNFNPVFGATVADDCQDNKIYHKYTSIQGRLSLENTSGESSEPSTRNYTIFVARLRDRVPATFWNQTTGAFTAGGSDSYVMNNGIAFLNPKMWRTIIRKEITLTNLGTALTASGAQSQYGTDYRFSWIIKNRCYVENPQGNWKALQTALDPSRQYYLLILNNEDSGDVQSGTLSVNIIQGLRKI